VLGGCQIVAEGAVGVPARCQAVPWAARGDANDEMMDRDFPNVLTLTLFLKDV
jgi:hypothetical protein